MLDMTQLPCHFHVEKARAFKLSVTFPRKTQTISFGGIFRRQETWEIYSNVFMGTQDSFPPTSI